MIGNTHPVLVLFHRIKTNNNHPILDDSSYTFLDARVLVNTLSMCVLCIIFLAGKAHGIS